MTRERLKACGSDADCLALYQAVKAEGDLRSFLKTYLYDEDAEVTLHALWALTRATKEELRVLHPMFDELIDKSMKTNSTSTRRITLSLIERLQMEVDDLRTDFLDFCLDHMMRANEKPSIQSLCMKLAYRMCAFYPELMEELKRTLETMDISCYTPAVHSVHRKILRGNGQPSSHTKRL